MAETTKGAIALEFAGFWRRIGALSIDVIILVAVFSFFEPAHNQIFEPIWQIPFLSESASWLSKIDILTSPGALIISGFYYIVSWAWRSQTLGMMVAGVKVLRTDGTEIDVLHSIIRYFGYVLSIIPLMFGFIWIAFDPKNQAWHDKMADTYVVKIPVLPEAATTPPTAAA